VALFSKKIRLFVSGRKSVWTTLSTHIDPQARYVWVHTASLGEFEQGLPVIKALRKQGYKVLVTFFSPSGYEVRKDYKGADVVCYLPFDSPTAARRFIKWARPEMAFFIKYEFWRNYIDVLSKKSIPVYSVSSIFRPGQIFFRWYGRKYARCLRRITHFFVQNERSVELLRTIGVQDNVTIVGDTRFDRVIDIRNAAKPLPIVEQFIRPTDGNASQPFVLVAGSSWQPDEDILLDYVNRHPDLRLVIAPHVVNDAHIQEIEQKLTTPALRYSHYNSFSGTRQAKRDEIEAGKMKIEWGSQIRNYVMHPYKLVKDVRTGYESTDVDSVMNGELDDFLKAYLMLMGQSNTNEQ